MIGSFVKLADNHAHCIQQFSNESFDFRDTFREISAKFRQSAFARKGSRGPENFLRVCWPGCSTRCANTAAKEKMLSRNMMYVGADVDELSTCARKLGIFGLTNKEVSQLRSCNSAVTQL